MKVLFITHVLAMAGANRSMLQLITELRESYHVEVVVLLPWFNYEGYSIKDKLQELGIETIGAPIRFFKKETSSRHDKKEYVRFLLRNRNFYKRLKKYNFDLVHSNSSVIDAGAYISRQLGVKHVWHLREFGDLDYQLYPILGKGYERIVYRLADAYIAISERVKRHFVGMIDSRKIMTIYNGIHLKDGTPLSVHQNAELQFFCAGVICDIKNQYEILQASLILVQRGETRFHVTLVGIQSQPYTDKLFSFIERNDLQSYVTILPEQDGIQNLAATMDVGIVPSQCEAFGRVTVEYMLQNLAVIVNDEGANPEIIENNQSGLLYSHLHPEKLADCMQSMIADRALVDRLAESGRKRAEEKFLSKYNTSSIFQLYESLL